MSKKTSVPHVEAADFSKLLTKPDTTAFGDDLAADFADHARQMMAADDKRLANDVMQIYAGALMIMVATTTATDDEIIKHTRDIIRAIREARAAIAEGD